MQRKIIFLLCFLYSFTFYAQPLNLKGMDSKERNAYLVKKAKEVIMNFGPDYYREYKEPEISDLKVFSDENDPRQEIRNIIGREYYSVIIPYDKNKEFLEWSYAAEVGIWADDGEPMLVIFGCNKGINFFFRPYKEWVKAGIKDEEKVPYKSLPMQQHIKDSTF